MGYGCGNCGHVERRDDWETTGTGWCPLHKIWVCLCEPAPDCDDWVEEEDE